MQLFDGVRPVRWYFVLAFVISWSGVLLAAARHELYFLFVAMLLGPSLSSIALTAYYERARGLRELAQRLLHWRIGARWYAWLLVAPLTLGVVAGALSLYAPSFRPGFAVPFALIAGFGAGMFEELGWTGFATPRLLRRYSWWQAGLVLGLPWAIWHLLADYVGRDAHGWLWIAHALQWIVALCAFRIVMTWVYSQTRSLLLGILLHVSFTGSQGVLWPANPTLPVELVWYGLFAVALWIPVVVLVAKANRSRKTKLPVGQERIRISVAYPGPKPASRAGMPTFSNSDTRVVTIHAPQDEVIRALSEPDRIKEALADELESSAKVDDHTARWIRKPVEEKGVRFRADYTVHYEYDGHDKITWHTIGNGNMRANGEARLAKAPDGTRVEYSESIECDMEVNRILAAVLRPIVERKIKSGIGDYLAHVKARLEHTAA